VPSWYNCPLFSFFIFFCILFIMVSHFRMSFHNPRLNRREGGRRHTHSLIHSDTQMQNFNSLWPRSSDRTFILVTPFKEIQPILFLIISWKHFKFSNCEYIKLNLLLNFISDESCVTRKYMKNEVFLLAPWRPM